MLEKILEICEKNIVDPYKQPITDLPSYMIGQDYGKDEIARQIIFIIERHIKIPMLKKFVKEHADSSVDSGV